MKRIIVFLITLMFMPCLSVYAQTHFDRMSRGDSGGDRDANISSRGSDRSAGDQGDNRQAVTLKQSGKKGQVSQGKQRKQTGRQNFQRYGARGQGTGVNGNTNQRQRSSTISPSSGTNSIQTNRQFKNKRPADQINRENQKRAFTKPNMAGAKTAQIPDRVRKMGVTHLPPAFANQHKILRTDRQHSTISVPSVGPKGAHFGASLISPKRMSAPTVKNHMNLIVRDAHFRDQVTHFNASEMHPNQYYWHTWNHINYCHYYDPWGFHWYGWHMGADFFWTRYYSGYWWWYECGV